MFIPPFDTINFYVYVYVMAGESFKLLYDNHVTRLDDALSKPIGQVTSRDEFIDPYSLVNPSNYGRSRAEIARYKSDLQRAELYLSQQQASYKEWYESSEQQAIRDREAGLNPDLLGLGENEAGDVPLNPVSPVDGLETNGQVASRVVESIVGVVGTLSNVASLASAFVTLPPTLSNLGKQGNLLDAQIEAQDISNTSALGVQMANDIGDLLATAMQAHLDSGSEDPFDLDGFFSNDDNFAALKEVYGSNPRYTALLAKQKKAVLEHQKKAVNLQKDVAQGYLDYGQVASNPFLSPSQKLTILQLRPFTEACVKADLAEVNLRKVIADWKSKVQEGISADKAIRATNAQFDSQIEQGEYLAKYYDSVDPVLVAGFEQFMREVQTTSGSLEQLINQGYIDMFNNDPTGVGAWRAAYLYGSNGGASWNEAYIVRSIENTKALIDAEVAVARATGKYADAKAMLDAFGSVLTGLSTDSSLWENNNAGWSMYRSELTEYITNLQKVLENLE